MFRVWCFVFGVSCLVFRVWCFVFGVSCLVFRVLRLAFNLIEHNRFALFAIRYSLEISSLAPPNLSIKC